MITTTLKRSLFILLAAVFMAVPVFAQQSTREGVIYVARAIDTFNMILLITSLLCIKQVLFPEENKTLFQLLNGIFIVLFFITSISFLISYRALYDGFQNETPMGCVRKMFFSFNIPCLQQWFLLITFVINVWYVIRNAREENYLKNIT
jgi:hypothetical protein